MNQPLPKTKRGRGGGGAREGTSAGSWGLGCGQVHGAMPTARSGTDAPPGPSSHPPGDQLLQKEHRRLRDVCLANGSAGGRPFAWPKLPGSQHRTQSFPSQRCEESRTLLQAAEDVLHFPSFCSLFFVLPSAERRSQASLVTLPLFTASFSSISLPWPGASQPAPCWPPQASPRGSPAPWTSPSSSQCSRSPSQHVPTASLLEQTAGASFLESFLFFFF